MHDIRLTSRGGARLSDILPDYALKGTQTITRRDGNAENVAKPSCPHGYAKAIIVTPIQYSQYVKGASLHLELTTNEGSNTVGHTHSITGDVNTITQNINGNVNGNTLRVNGSGGNVNTGTSLTLTQLPPVHISITNSGDNWAVGLTYGGEAPTVADPITALAQTYCVYQDTGRGISASAATSNATEATGLRIETKSASIVSSARSTKTCTEDADCANTEKCDNSGKCIILGSCSDSDGTAIEGKAHTYCLEHQQVYLECFDNSGCNSGKTCKNNRCAGGGS